MFSLRLSPFPIFSLILSQETEGLMFRLMKLQQVTVARVKFSTTCLSLTRKSCRTPLISRRSNFAQNRSASLTQSRKSEIRHDIIPLTDRNIFVQDPRFLFFPLDYSYAPRSAWMKMHTTLSRTEYSCFPVLRAPGEFHFHYYVLNFTSIRYLSTLYKRGWSVNRGGNKPRVFASH